MVAVFFKITDGIKMFDLIFILTAGGPGGATETIATYIQKIGIQRMEFGYSSASGIIMLGIAAIIGAVSMKFMYTSNN
jgi:ABC-type sugar transport system permease subunit